MQTALYIVLAMLLCFPQILHAASGSDVQEKNTPRTATHIRILVDNQEVVVAMLDNSASRDFLALLPLTLEFSDYVGIEKIAYLPQKLQIQNAPSAQKIAGDFTYYAPWGNLAIFYKGQGSGSQLYTLGHIKSGKEILARKNAFTARIERLP